MSENDETLRCGFCGKSQHDVKKLVAAEQVSICDECVELCANIIKKKEEDNANRLLPRNTNGAAKTTREAGTPVLYCSFCGKTKGEVGHFVAGLTVFICNECVELCTTLV